MQNPNQEIFEEFFKNAKQVLRFFEKHKVLEQLKSKYLVLIPTDEAIENFVNENNLGIESIQFSRSKIFKNIMYNHLSQNFNYTDVDLDPINFESVNGNKFVDVHPEQELSIGLTTGEFIKFASIDKLLVTESQMKTLKANLAKEFPFLKHSDKSNNTFGILDKAALYNILVKLDPKSILNTCKVDKRFEHICKDESIFKD